MCPKKTAHNSNIFQKSQKLPLWFRRNIKFQNYKETLNNLRLNDRCWDIQKDGLKSTLVNVFSISDDAERKLNEMVNNGRV